MKYLDATYLLNGIVCGHDHFLGKYTRHTDYNVDLSGYYDAVNASFTNDSFTPSPKRLPIVFHLLDDGVSFSKTDLNIPYILMWVNHWFSASNIEFAAADYDPDGNEMPTPGLNVIDASNLTEVRNGNTYTYTDDFVAFDKYEDYNNNIPIPGILLRNIQKNYSWDNYKYINIFLVNRTNSGVNYNQKIAMTSVHPFIAEAIDPTLLSGVIDLWALGRPHYDDTPVEFNVNVNYTNFGYEYNSSAPAASNTLNWGSLSFGEPSRARTVVHTLAHILGVPHVRTGAGFRGGPREIDTCEDNQYFNPKVIFKDAYGPGVIFEDPFTDTYATPNIDLLLDPFVTSCNGNTAVTHANTHMHINQFLSYPVNSDIPTNINFYFTPQQIKWMHANFTYSISSANSPGSYEINILSKIITNSSATLKPPTICANESYTVANPNLNENEQASEAADFQGLLQTAEGLINSIE